MQTINNQGQEIEATLVNYLSGTIPTSTVDTDGDEELFRDEAGRYYLRRQLGLRADYHEDHGEGNIPASGCTHVHRISVNAAILWATTRLNSETLDLRNDAANLLMENRSYTDPFPLHMNAVKRNGQPATATAPVCVVDGPVSGATADGWFDGCIQPEEGSGARVRTIFDLDPLHADLLRMFTERHGINVAVLARASLISQLEAMYNGNDQEEEPAAVHWLLTAGLLGSGSSGIDRREMQGRIETHKRTVASAVSAGEFVALDALPADQLYEKLAHVDGPRRDTLSPTIPSGCIRMSLLHGDGSIYNRFDISAKYLGTIEENALQHGNVFRRVRNTAFVQAKGRFDEREAA